MTTTLAADDRVDSPEAQLTAGTVVRQVVRVVADATGRTPTEVWVLFARAVALGASRTIWHGAVRIVHYAMDPDQS